VSDFETSVLRYYETRVGACAHYCATYLKVERSEVSKALQRLKKKGLVTNDGSYWKRVI
jgi:Mn-dependent DtxR family transcriptional regulator